MKRLIPVLIAILFILCGCTWLGGSSNRGGLGTLKYHNKVTELFPDGKTITTEKIVDVSIAQPDNPNDAANVVAKFDNAGNVTVATNTGGSHNTPKDLAIIKSTSPLMWSGIGLIVVGGFILFGSKLKQLVWGGGFIALGMVMSILAVVLPGQMLLFTLLIVAAICALLGYLVYIIYKNIKKNTALEENISVIEMLKRKYMSAEDVDKEFKKPGGVVYEAQSTSTKKIVDQIREEIEENG